MQKSPIISIGRKTKRHPSGCLFVLERLTSRRWLRQVAKYDFDGLDSRHLAVREQPYLCALVLVCAGV